MNVVLSNVSQPLKAPGVDVEWLLSGMAADIIGDISMPEDLAKFQLPNVAASTPNAMAASPF